MKDQKIQTPPLPAALLDVEFHARAYAIEAIELDRQCRGEPVVYLPEDHLEQVKRLGTVYTSMSIYPRDDRVAVFLSPQPAAPTIKESLTVAEPAKVPSDADILKCAERAYVNNQHDEENYTLEFARALLARYGSKS